MEHTRNRTISRCYLEITNICNLACSFCPGTRRAPRTMTVEEFTMAREQMKASYILGLESTSARMQSAGRRMLLMNETRTESEIIDRVNAIRHEDVNALMREILTAPHSTALVGKDAERIAKEI